MPSRLRPTAPVAADAILVGDPGRALTLAQDLLAQPKMSNHARGLWGYSGLTDEGRELTVQSTGMGGPSATVVLHDLAELGVRRAIRIGTCTSLLTDPSLGEILVVERAQPFSGSLRTLNDRKEPRNWVRPDPALTARLRTALPGARTGSVVSLDRLHRHLRGPELVGDVADMQTAGLFAAGAELGVSLAALLVVSDAPEGAALADEGLEAATKEAGAVAAAVLSP